MSGRILVIEDDRDIASTVCDALQSEMGETVVCVHGAREALAAIGQERPDLILVDLMLPDDSGIELAELLRENGGDSLLLVAMTSSFLLAEVARESGLFQAVLDKPFDVDDLLLCISELLPEPEPAVC